MAHTYYLVKVGRDLYDMRQTRYKKQFDAGKEHPHDLCAAHFTAAGIRELIRLYNFDVDLSNLTDTSNP